MALQHRHSSRLVSHAAAVAIGLCALGGTSAYAQNWADSFSELLHSLVSKPGYDEANRGYTAEKMGRHQEALDDLNKAVALDSRNAVYLHMRAVIKYNMKDYRGAIADYRETLKLDDNHQDTYMELGKAEYFAHDYAAAIDDLNRAIVKNPKSVAAYMQRGVVYLDTGKYTEAAKDFDFAISLEPNNGQALQLKREADQKASTPDPSQGQATQSKPSSDDALRDVLRLEPQKPKPPNFKYLLDPQPSPPK
jgi:tetratricopeptide (TPR) repeat protein